MLEILGNSRALADDYLSMDCTQYREILSADLDGEADAAKLAEAMGHLLGCARCRAARADMVALAELVSQQPRANGPDLSGAVLAESRAWTRARRGASRVALGVLGLVLAAGSVPDLLATNREAHLEHHLAIWGFTLATTFALIALRPRAARMVRPVLTLFAVAMVAVALLDIGRGETPMLAEAHHLLEVLGVALVWVVALPARRPRSIRNHGLRLVSGEAEQEVG